MLPNILTVLRLFSPFYYLLTLIFIEDYNFEKVAILFLFIFFSLTDFFDGYYARKYNLVSSFGKIFDPISDKVLVIITLIYLSYGDINVLYPTLLIVFREFIVSGIREYSLHSSGKSINVTMASKIKTALQFISIICLILNDILLQTFSLNLYLYAYITLWTATILTLFTGYQYCNNIFNK